MWGVSDSPARTLSFSKVDDDCAGLTDSFRLFHVWNAACLAAYMTRSVRRKGCLTEDIWQAVNVKMS